MCGSSINQKNLKKQLSDRSRSGVPVRHTFVYAFSQNVPCNNDPNNARLPTNGETTAAESRRCFRCVIGAPCFCIQKIITFYAFRLIDLGTTKNNV